MAEPNPTHDEATDYLLGHLKPEARRAFEKRLAADASLRRVVRELEEGASALAMTVAPANPPREAWANIEAAIAREAGQRGWRALLLFRWLPGGWLAPAALAVAGLVWFGWFRSPPSHDAGIASNDAEATSGSSIAQSDAVQNVPHANGQGTTEHVTAATTSLPKHTRGNHVETTGPNSLASGPAIAMGGSNQGAGNASTNTNRDSALKGPAYAVYARLSPEVQQAVLHAVARQMGWSADQAAPIGGGLVDFVDLTAPKLAANTATISLPPESDSTAVDYGTTQTNALATATNSGVTAVASVMASSTLGTSADQAAVDTNSLPDVPILAWNNNLIVTIDPVIAGADGGAVTVWAVEANGKQTVVGTATLGSNPLVINIADANTTGGTRYLVTLGGKTVIGQFPP